MLTWSLSYRVSATQDRADRYNQVKSHVTIPPECATDEETAHQQIEDEITNDGEPDKPYAVYTQGWRNGDEFEIAAYIDPSA